MRFVVPASRRARTRRAAAMILSLMVVAVLTQVGGTTSSASGATLTPDCSGQTPPPKASGAAWTCMLDDEFDGTTLGPAWVPTQTSLTGVATGAGSYRACYVNSTNNISVSKGTLRLTVRKEKTAQSCKASNGTFSTRYTAGSVSTFGKFWQTYGRFSVRAKVPNSNVKGLQETLWLWPNNTAKYASSGPGWCEPTGEIDFAEFYSNVATRNVPFIHYCYDSNTVNRTSGTNAFNALPPPNNQPGTDCTFDYTTWNVFTVDWQPGVITLYVNDKTCVIDHYQATGLTSPAPFDSPFFLALSQGLGVTISNSDNGTTSRTMIPATMQIDYVRVWK
jgi:beta-glucanase (GH16 family)